MINQPIPLRIKIFSILHIVFGTFGLVVTFSWLSKLSAINEILKELGLTSEVAIKAMNFSSKTLQPVMSFLYPAMSLILLILGIGLLLKKPWARLGSIIYGFVAIAFSIWIVIMVVTGFSEITSSSFSDQLNRANQIIITGFTGEVAISALFNICYQALAILSLNRPNARATQDKRDENKL
jgi:hypothetical protein